MVKPAIKLALDRVVFASAVRSHGGSSGAITRAVRDGTLIPLSPRVYLPSVIASSLGAREISEVRDRASALEGASLRPLARRSAARVWGIPLLGPADDAVDLLGWNASATRRGPHRRYWGTPLPDDMIVQHDGVTLTSLPRTLAELCAVENFDAAVVALDWAIRGWALEGEPVTTIDEVREAADALRIVRGRARLSRALGFADARSESPGESLSRAMMHRLGFVVPELQVERRGRSGRRYRCDFGWAEAALVGEFDGMVKYGATTSDARGARDALIDEKLREDDIRAGGVGMVRWVWRDLRPAPFTSLLLGAGVPCR